MAEQTFTYHFTVHGFIWRGDDKPIQMSGVFDEYPDKPVYLENANVTEAIRLQARKRGVSMGVIVDELNDTIPRPKPIASWRFDNLNQEQIAFLRGMFPDLDGNEFP